MRSMILAAVIAAALGACSLAETPSDDTPDCIAKLMRDTRAGDSITVITRDSNVIHGSRPVINTAGATMYMQEFVGSGMTNGVTIPFADIGSLYYCKPSPAQSGLTFIGFGVGCVAGMMIANASTESGWDFDEIPLYVLGGVGGGIIGATVGNQIGKGVVVEVVIRCD